jgi:glycosyltransferase involved in cell wall biosynthesis
MNHQKHHLPPQPYLVWVYGGRLESALDSATWLNTTRELRNLGWNMTLIASGPTGVHTISGTEVYCIYSPDVYLLRHIVFNIKLVGYILSRWSSISLILFNQVSAPWLLPLNILRILFHGKRPLFILDTRTVPMEDIQTASIRDKLRGWFYNSINSFANGIVDGQTAITLRMATRVQIPPDRLWGTWPSGADSEIFKPAIKERKWPQEGSPIVLIYIGVLHYERNLMALARAIEKANLMGMNFRLILTGSGSEKDDLDKFAKQTNGRIQVNSPIPHDQIPALLAQAHVGVLPFPDDEKYRVSSPIKLFEYLASGLAVMATRIACHTDVIRSGSYVFWAENASMDELYKTLEDIWNSRSDLETMGTEAAYASQYWTWKESAKKLSQALLYGLVYESQAYQIAHRKNRST